MNFNLRSWFFETTATATKRGTRLKEGDKPPEATFQSLADSIVFKTEGNDRAKEDATTTPLAELNGHVVAATDAQAKANQAKKADRTLVAQPSQLPTVIADPTASSLTYKELDASYVESSTTHNDKLVEVAADGTASKNNFVVNIFADFIVFLQGLTTSFNDIVDKVKVIRTDTDTNATNIGNLQGAVGGNFDQLLPIGSTTFHLAPSMTADAIWKPADGATVISKYLTPGDSGSGNAVIYDMLSVAFTLVNAPDADYFLLPDLSYHMAYQELIAGTYTVGFTSGKWGGLIANNNLPDHTHAHTLSVDDAGEHTHGFTTGEGDIGQGGNVGRGKNAFLGNQNTKEAGSHGHTISGGITAGGGVSSPDEFTFTPPKLGGGWLIKVA